ncbi:MAG: efflux RND transporter permease subunit [Chitinophagales bacterium]|nr:efflux RND transporter permease subunit [Chitinophagales bacterium]
MKHTPKEFKPTSWAINNKTSIFIFTVIVMILGIATYNSLPKEQFPDIVIPTIFVSTYYPGTSPTDMENLVTRHIEKEIKSISGIKKITSNSVQDFATIVVEFNTGVVVADAKQKVKDAVDKSKRNLPTDLSTYGDPQVIDINFSEFPMENINLSGDIELSKLKKYSDDLKDRIEELPAVTRVDIVGAPEREIQVDLDMYKMEIAQVTTRDVEDAIAYENVIVSGGQIPMSGMKRSLKVDGEFTDMDQIRNLIIQTGSGDPIYLRDIATVTDGYKEKESYARLDEKNVITLNVIKRSGQNLIQTSDKVRDIVKDMQETQFPQQLKISVTGDQSTQTRNTLTDLLNSIIIGFVLVTLILMFFMGPTNAIFVGLSVPLSIFLAFLVMPTIGFNLNMIVLFSLLFALGIVVDDAIVVIENTWRILNQTKLPVSLAAKYAAGEVFAPVLAGTLTTLSPFVPLAFWPGIVGKFMFYLPITLILTLLASLVVAYIINPVFAVTFMKIKEEPGHENGVRKKSNRTLYITSGAFVFLAIIFYLFKSPGLGNFTLFLLALVYLNKYVLTGLIARFQQGFIPRMQHGYARVITWALGMIHFKIFGRRYRIMRPWMMLLGTVLLFIFSFVMIGLRQPPIEFFPTSDPNFIYVYAKLPVGTDVRVTDSVTKTLEKKVFDIVGKNNPIVDAVIGNVAIGADDNQFGGGNPAPNKGKVTVAFKEYKYRNGQSTRDYMDKIRSSVKNLPGVEISVDQEQGGPPTGKPINIEITGDDYNQLIATSIGLRHYLDSVQIPGVEALKSDAEVSNPEIAISLDRERMRRENISTGQVGSEIRTAVYGNEASKYRELEDEYPIMVRYDPSQRKDLDALSNLKITFRNQNNGQIRQIPLSSIASISYNNSLGAVTRKNLKRVITLSSNVLNGYTPTEVNQNIGNAVKDFKIPEGLMISQTGQQEEQDESQNFLMTAMMISLCLIFLILVTQFNSFSKPLIILSEILFSIIGVLLGFAIFKMKISIVMTGIGIVGLAGIAVRNGILLVEFADELKARGLKTRDAIIQAGKTRMTPVILTASATMLALVPLAVGFNIDFVSLFTHLQPHIYFGGDNVAFWGPLSWTIIFGLSFATFLTLILVPCMYLIAYSLKVKLSRWRGRTFGIRPAKKVEEPENVEILI